MYLCLSRSQRSHKYSANHLCTYPWMDHLCHMPRQFLPLAFADSAPATAMILSRQMPQQMLFGSPWSYKSGFTGVSSQSQLTWRPSLETISANCNDYKGYSLMSLRLAASWKFPCTCFTAISHVAIWSDGEHIHLTHVLLRNKGALVHNKYHEDNILPSWG